MDALLADGRTYLTGATLTFADITFASLGALAVLPPEYPGNRLGGPRLTIDDITDPAWRAEVERFRARPSGQFILRLYREERAPHPG
jgi:glutathione S-transferase